MMLDQQQKTNSGLLKNQKYYYTSSSADPLIIKDKIFRLQLLLDHI